jgi:predicted ester cyclase
MSSQNVETLSAAHESWNKRDFDGVIHYAVENLLYTDHGLLVTMNTREELKQWAEGWAAAFSDGRITDPQYIDAGDVVVAQFTAEGTNDGPLHALKPTGRHVSLTLCEVCRFNEQGQIVSGDCYYDRFTLLIQLGHIQPPS